jgi:ribonuclease HI
MSIPDVLTIHIDGAARGNPGPAAFAYVIERDGAPPIEAAECLGKTTNNVAEYTALVRALERAAELGAKRLLIRSDSELLVKQMNGEYRVKNEQLLPLYEAAQRLARRFDLVTLSHVRREQNKRADALCNQALDGQQGAAAPAKAERARPSKGGNLEGRVREAAVDCLRTAATAWARDGARAVDPAVVWEQLWSILEEAGVLRKTK